MDLQLFIRRLARGAAFGAVYLFLAAPGGAGAPASAATPAPADEAAQCIVFAGPDGPVQMYRRSSDVFSGVVEKKEPTGIDGSHVPVEIATVRVLEQWKGRKTTTIRVATTDTRFEINGSYLFFAGGDPLSTSLACRWTEPLDGAGAKQKLTWLNSLPAREVNDSSPPPRRFAILDDAAARPFWTARMCSRPGPGPIESSWTPDADSVVLVRLEFNLTWALAMALDAPAARADKRLPTEYYRQYAGFVSGGKKRVYINGLHETTIRGPEQMQTWRTSAQVACDGGTLFFGAIYDVDSGTITGLTFNGAR